MIPVVIKALAFTSLVAPGFAAPLNRCTAVWEAVAEIALEITHVTTTRYPGQAFSTVISMMRTTAAEATPTATGHIPQEEWVDLSTYISATIHATTTGSTLVVQPATDLSSILSAPAATLFTSSSSAASPAYNGACSKISPCNGDVTYYDTANTTSNPSSCGTTNDGLTELVLALPQGIMANSECGKSVTITYHDVTKTGTVVDKCPSVGCDNNSVDLSRAFFQTLVGSLDAGRISGVEWYIN
jgi:hypothetical protein